MSEIPKTQDELLKKNLERPGMTTSLAGSPTPEKQEELINRNSGDKSDLSKDTHETSPKFPEYPPDAAQRAMSSSGGELNHPKGQDSKDNPFGPAKDPHVTDLNPRLEDKGFASNQEGRAAATQGPNPLPQPSKASPSTPTRPTGVRAQYFGEAGGTKHYFYRVRANFPFGSSEFSEVAEMVGSSSLSSSNRMLVSWEPTPGAVSYDVIVTDNKEDKISGRICVAQGETALHFTDGGNRLAMIPER